jgi:hypothetical protein
MGMKSLLTAAVAAVGFMAMAVPASAMPYITGGLVISGSVSTDGTDLSNNTKLTGFDALTFASSGDMTTTGHQVVNIKDLTFDPFSGPINGFFTVTVDAGTLTFDLQTVSLGSPRTATHLDLYGTGILHLANHADTAIRWDFSATNSGTVEFGFDSTVAPVPAPEPASIALLGAGLAGLGMRRKKRAA